MCICLYVSRVCHEGLAAKVQISDSVICCDASFLFGADAKQELTVIVSSHCFIIKLFQELRSMNSCLSMYGWP